MLYGYDTTSVFLKLNCGDCIFRGRNTSSILVFHVLNRVSADSILFVHVGIHFSTYRTKSIRLIPVAFCSHSHLVESSRPVITKLLFYYILIRNVLVELNLVSYMRSHSCRYQRCCHTFCISEYFFGIPVCSRITSLTLYLLFRILSGAT